MPALVTGAKEILSNMKKHQKLLGLGVAAGLKAAGWSRTVRGPGFLRGMHFASTAIRNR